jgi:two-component system, sensor histidine kinase and response regulator
VAIPRPVATETPVLSASKKSIDLETVLHRCSDKPDLAERVLDKLSSQARESLEKIETSFAAADAAGVARIAHGLKGAAGMAAATTLAAVAGQLEQIAKAGDLGLATEVLSSLQAEVFRCNQFINQALKELSVMDRAQPRIGGGRPKPREYDDADNNC